MDVASTGKRLQLPLLVVLVSVPLGQDTAVTRQDACEGIAVQLFVGAVVQDGMKRVV